MMDPKKPKASTKTTWPMHGNCKRNCQDCGKSVQWDGKPISRMGLTTGTQCTAKKQNVKVGDRVEITLERSSEKTTINTKDFGGMPIGHTEKLGEVDRDVTGSVWTVTAKVLESGEVIEVGKIMFEGDYPGMRKLGTFDEMIGCNKCNSVQHKDTRWGPFIFDADGTVRKPYQMRAKNKVHGSTCKMYKITGSAEDYSISYEGGPFTENPNFQDGKRHVVWTRDE